MVEIDKLFEMEADSKTAGLSVGERLELRREKAEPIVKSLKQQIESARAAALPRDAVRLWLKTKFKIENNSRYHVI